MKLSRLLYNAVKEAKFSDDTSFTYSSFKQGAFDDVNDYVNEINNVFDPLNRVIHELSDNNKIPFKIAQVVKGDDNVIPINGYGLAIKQITNVFYLDKNGDYIHLNFRNIGTSRIVVIGYCPKDIYVEYIEDIKNFTREDYRYTTEQDEANGIEHEESDIELSDYGINETMCSYIQLYVRGYLLIDSKPEQAMAFINEAKRQISNLEVFQTAFYQKGVKTTNRIED